MTDKEKALMLEIENMKLKSEISSLKSAWQVLIESSCSDFACDNRKKYRVCEKCGHVTYK